MLVLNRLNLLVVDDDCDARLLLTLMLEAEGAEVVAVASANEALAVLERLKPDVLVSDIAMPETDGYSLLSQVRSLEVGCERQIPAIAVTALDGDDLRLRSLSAGFQMHLPKPVDPDQLVAAIASVIQQTNNNSLEAA